jgi:hypothetical protein
MASSSIATSWKKSGTHWHPSTQAGTIAQVPKATVGVVNCGAHQADSWTRQAKINELQDKLNHIFSEMKGRGVSIICCQELHDDQLTRISFPSWECTPSTDAGSVERALCLKVHRGDFE